MSHQLPAAVRATESTGLAPWDGKPVVAPAGRREQRVSWLPLRLIRPALGRAETWGRPMTAPGDAYPAIVIDAENRIIDGHHRYWTLVDLRWQGRVPVVRGPLNFVPSR